MKYKFKQIDDFINFIKRQKQLYLRILSFFCGILIPLIVGSLSYFNQSTNILSDFLSYILKNKPAIFYLYYKDLKIFYFILCIFNFFTTFFLILGAYLGANNLLEENYKYLDKLNHQTLNIMNYYYNGLIEFNNEFRMNHEEAIKAIFIMVFLSNFVVTNVFSLIIYF